MKTLRAASYVVSILLLTAALLVAWLNWETHQIWQQVNQLNQQLGDPPAHDTARFIVGFFEAGFLAALSIGVWIYTRSASRQA